VNDYEEFLAAIPVEKRLYLDTLDRKQRQQVLNYWWLWWARYGRKQRGAHQGRLFAGEWKEGPWSRNPDARTRDLERAAAAGDPGAERRLREAYDRTGRCSRCGAGKPFPDHKPGKFCVSWARDEQGLKMCWACAAQSDMENMQAVVYDDRWSGYTQGRPEQGRFYYPVVSGFTGYPLIWGYGSRGGAGFGGRSFHWRGHDRYGREWWGWNAETGQGTRMRLYKDTGGLPGREHVERANYSATPMNELRWAQDRWMEQHGGQPLGVRFNPDELDRQHERAAAGGDLEASARVISAKVRRGEIPMANVSLAATLAGRRDAALLDPPPYDHQYVHANRRDLVRWALRLDRYLPLSEMQRALLLEPALRRERDQLIGWVQGETNHKPGGTAIRMPTAGPGALYADALRLCRARSNGTIHNLVKRVIKNYQIRVWKTFLDELHGHHGDRQESPVWDCESVRVEGETTHYDPLVLRSEARRQATQLLGRMLLHEA
jgi:hypothetical protein